MMRNEPPFLWRPSLLQYLVCYAVWFGLSAMIVWLMVQLRLNLLDISLVLDLGPWVHLLIDRWSFLALGMVALSAIVLLEHYLRTGLHTHKFWPRAARVLLIQASLLAFSYAFLAGFRLFGGGSGSGLP